MRRCCWWLAASLSLALLRGWCVGFAPPTVEEDITVMTFNIRTASRWAERDGGDRQNGRSWSKRRAKVAKSIAIGGAAIVGTQEGLAWQLDELLKELGPSWRRCGGGRMGSEDDAESSDENERAAVLFDTAKVELVESRDFWLSKTPDTPASRSWGAALPRVATLASFRRRSTEQHLRVLNTHFDHASDEARTEAAKLVCDVSQRERVHVVTGDFNAAKDEAWFSAMVAGDNLVDAWTRADARSCGSCTASTYHAWNGALSGTDPALAGTRHVDAVFLSRKHLLSSSTAGSGAITTVDVPRARVITDDKRRKAYGGPFASDHYPVAATLRFKTRHAAAGGIGGCPYMRL